MPLGERDVLDTLSDPITQNMNFHVDQVQISGEFFTTIRDHVRAGNIVVVSGTGSLAYYNSGTDILTTQKGTPPADLGQRAQILHECTHALVDVFNDKAKVTSHINELASYIVQVAYELRSLPSWPSASDGSPWGDFWAGLHSLVKTTGIDKASGNGARISAATLEPLRVQLAALPHVDYGSYSKEHKDSANGLSRNHMFLTDYREELSTKSSSVAMEPYPDPSDDYLISTLLERYNAADVAGYGKRFRRLRLDFAKCSLGRALALRARLSGRRKGDRVSELFYDRLSTGGQAILLQILAGRK